MASLEEYRKANHQKGVSFTLSLSFHLNSMRKWQRWKLHVLLAVYNQHLLYKANTVVFGVMKMTLGLK